MAAGGPAGSPPGTPSPTSGAGAAGAPGWDAGCPRPHQRGHGAPPTLSSQQLGGCGWPWTWPMLPGHAGTQLLAAGLLGSLAVPLLSCVVTRLPRPLTWAAACPRWPSESQLPGPAAHPAPLRVLGSLLRPHGPRLLAGRPGSRATPVPPPPTPALSALPAPHLVGTPSGAAGRQRHPGPLLWPQVGASPALPAPRLHPLPPAPCTPLPGAPQGACCLLLQAQGQAGPSLEVSQPTLG